MIRYFFYIIIIFFYNLEVLAKNTYEFQTRLINNGIIKENIKCNKLVNELGGLNRIKLLWLGDSKQEKFQYALINIDEKYKNKIFYLCENSNKNIIKSEKTIQVLSERNLLKIYYNSKDLFTDIFSITSKESRNYIMSTLNIKSFNYLLDI